MLKSTFLHCTFIQLVHIEFRQLITPIIAPVTKLLSLYSHHLIMVCTLEMMGTNMSLH